LGTLESSNPQVNFSFKIAEHNQTTSVHTKLPGAYNFANLLAACCVGSYFRVPETNIKTALEQYTPDNNRSQVVKKGSNTLLLDAYNANPSSMEAALLNFALMDAENKMAILGDMLELGNESATEHQRVVDLLEEKKINAAVLVGPQFKATRNLPQAQRFTTAAEALEWLKKNKTNQTLILIKGSRGIRLEDVLPAFEN
jgi:UDP-N-acetylmuramoyl-tripeptide--D-alanyl-D-alanine ligase